jgi:hypothetical protein
VRGRRGRGSVGARTVPRKGLRLNEGPTDESDSEAYEDVDTDEYTEEEEEQEDEDEDEEDEEEEEDDEEEEEGEEWEEGEEEEEEWEEGQEDDDDDHEHNHKDELSEERSSTSYEDFVDRRWRINEDLDDSLVRRAILLINLHGNSVLTTFVNFIKKLV